MFSIVLAYNESNTTISLLVTLVATKKLITNIDRTLRPISKRGIFKAMRNLKYMDIVEWATEQISSGTYKANDKFFSEAELGKKFNCSRQTVRRALEVLEQNGLITRSQGSGTFISPNGAYLPRQPLIGRDRSKTIGFINTYMDNCIFPGIIRGIEHVLSAEGYAMELISTENMIAGETRSLEFMLNRDLDGIIVEPTRSALPCVNLSLYNKINQIGLPMVFIDTFYPELSNPYVALDDEKAGYEATMHLLSMGHRKISAIFPHSHRQGHLRYLGYVKAHTEYGIPVNDEFVCWHSKENMNEILNSKKYLEQLLRSTAVLCYNDTTAVGIVDLLHQYGKSIPEDLSVVGIDNSELARICSLTSIDRPTEELGAAAANLLISMINGSDGHNILFPPKLVKRSSVRQIPL